MLEPSLAGFTKREGKMNRIPLFCHGIGRGCMPVLSKIIFMTTLSMAIADPRTPERRDSHDFKQSLNRSIFSPPAMKRNECSANMRALQLGGKIGTNIDGGYIVPTPLKALKYRFAAL